MEINNRIIDNVRAQDDVEEVRDDWVWFVSPLVNCIRMFAPGNPNDKDPDMAKSLYVNKAERLENRTISKLYGEAGLLPNDWELCYSAMIEDRARPHLLIAPIGVGKTSWLARFQCHLNDKNASDDTVDIRICYYNHHIEKAVPFASTFEKSEDLLDYLLYSKLLTALKEACETLERKDNRVPYLLNNEDWSAECIADKDRPKMQELMSLMEKACQILSDHNVKIFFLIDNLDEYTQTLQERACQTAGYMSSLPAIHTVIALRPETYEKTRVNLRGARRHAVLPVSLKDLLTHRYEYLWKEGGRESVRNIVNRLQEHKFEIDAVYVSTQEPDFLKNLHKKIIDILSANQFLDVMLQKLHNYNMREIIDVISRLIVSGFFSKKIIEDLNPDSDNELFFKNNREAIITTYLRGPFLRYRGPSDDYPVKMIHIFDVPSILNPLDMLITVRVMQIIRRIDYTGNQVQRICEELEETGYRPGDTKIATAFLAKHGFILDIGKQKAWGRDVTVKIEEDDMFNLAPAGQYLLEVMFDRFAFRYCEAIANTMSRPRNDSKPWCDQPGIVSLVENVTGILKLLVAAAEEELRRINSHPNHDTVRRNFSNIFLKADTKGHNFLINITRGCLNRAKHYRNVFEAAADYQAQTRLASLCLQMEQLNTKAIDIRQALLPRPPE